MCQRPVKGETAFFFAFAIVLCRFLRPTILSFPNRPPHLRDVVDGDDAKRLLAPSAILGDEDRFQSFAPVQEVIERSQTIQHGRDEGKGVRLHFCLRSHFGFASPAWLPCGIPAGIAAG
jgi:hypothetical protein